MTTKEFIRLLLFMFLMNWALSACTHYTCPTYSKANTEVETNCL